MQRPAPAQADPAFAEHEALASVRSLRLLMLLCVLAPLLLFAGFAAWRWQQMHDEAAVRLDRATRIAREHALKVFETNETMLSHIVDLADDGHEPAKLHTMLQAISREKPQIQSMWIMDAAGKPVAADRFETFPAGVNFADREFFKWHSAHPRSGRVYFSEVLIGKATKTPFFDVSRAVLDPQGRFAGVASTSLTPAYFLKFYEALSANEPGLSIAMFRQDGAIFSRWPELGPNGPTRIASDSPVLRQLIAGDKGGAIRAVSSLDNQERLLQYTKLGDFPVYVGTGLKLDAVHAAWAREMGLIFAFGLVPLLGVLVAGRAAMKRARISAEASRRLREEAQARMQVEEALRQSQKMEAMGRLTGGVAHDFNNALMVISANLHILERLHPQAAGKQTAAIGRAVAGATNLTRQLLAFSRRQALMPQVVALQDKLPALRDMLAPVLGGPVRLVVQVDPQTAPIEVDVAELELALINLAVNAKDAMPSGGSFTVHARNVPAPAGMRGTGPATAVVIEAHDSGAGIAPDVLARVFEPFFTTKPVGQGTGLGLSQVYGLCQRSGGTAQIHSRPGLGTSVEMYFPASARKSADAGADDGAADSSLDLRVVLVEDNLEVASAIRPVLEAQGCEVRHFANAAAAMGWIDAHAADVDVVLTDVVMPGELDGLTLAQKVRERHARIGLVVMTGYAQQLEAITRQGFTVLAKPWTPTNLARALRAQAALRDGVE
jgi:signal transduction histidine kinase/ActR/RegA family two-component response regulator